MGAKKSRFFFKFFLFHRSSNNTASPLRFRLSCLCSTASIWPSLLLLTFPSLSVISQGKASQFFGGTDFPPEPGALLSSVVAALSLLLPRALSAAFLQNIFFTAARAGVTKEEEEEL